MQKILVMSNTAYNDRKFNRDLQAIVRMFNGVSPEKRSIITKPVGRLIGAYVKGKIGREVSKSLYFF